ncbi:hypothetical protein EC973_004240 [Apophysomyces ossiformis]|uniref:Uncharacterized protein n=1 Tax=Apophysomyces ossiformis TaxID=679940 RepID=A0A8H7ESL9_9FUNG|nr:hypothetical protein EC973_004240 [Apophysomyces ossiformis]
MTDFHDVFQANPGAILGGSWGNAAGANKAQVGPQRTQPSSTSSTAVSEYSDDDDEEYAPLQMTSWGGQRPAQEDDDDDDDYAPLQMTSWGNQASNNNNSSDNAPQINVTMGDWSSLIDPNVKVKAGGLGSGGLHRKGANYKPVDEVFILNQRLKNQPIPKGTGGKKKSKSKPSTPKMASPKSNSPKPKSSASSYHPSPKPSSQPPLRAPARPRPPQGGEGSAWGSGQLASTPFWERPAAAPTSAPAPAPVPMSSSSSQSRWSSSAGASESKWSSGGGASESKWSSGGGASASKWSSGGCASESKWSSGGGASESKWSAGGGASESKWSSGGGATTSQWGNNATAAPQPPVQEEPVSNWASYAASQRQEQEQEQEQEQGRVSLEQRRPEGTSSANSVYATGYPSSNDAAPKERATIFSFNIELAPGIYAHLPIYETENYLELVNEFEKRHHLKIEDVAKSAFASKIRTLVEQQLANRQM